MDPGASRPRNKDAELPADQPSTRACSPSRSRPSSDRSAFASSVCKTNRGYGRSAVAWCNDRGDRYRRPIVAGEGERVDAGGREGGGGECSLGFGGLWRRQPAHVGRPRDRSTTLVTAGTELSGNLVIEIGRDESYVTAETVEISARRPLPGLERPIVVHCRLLTNNIFQRYAFCKARLRSPSLSRVRAGESRVYSGF